MEAEWDARPRPPHDQTAAPILSIDGIEGPLDWLVEQARARRIDLQRLSVLALVETFEAALLEALDGEVSAATLTRWGDWIVLAAELTLLRSRLMLRVAADAGTARDEAEALRRRLIGRAEMAAAASWLARRPQLGIETFGRYAAETARNAGAGRTGDITALLRGCLVVLAVSESMETAFRVRLPFWSVGDAVGRMRQLLAEMSGDEVGLEAFFPPVPLNVPERERRCRAAAASTFVAGLELAREGALTLTQASNRSPIKVGAVARSTREPVSDQTRPG